MQGGYAGNAAGMKISSLHKLTDIRSNKPGLTMLHYVAAQAEKSNPELLSLPEELAVLDDASKTSLEQLRSEVTQLDNQIKKIQNQMEAPNTQADVKVSNSQCCQLSQQKIEIWLHCYYFIPLQTWEAQLGIHDVEISGSFCEINFGYFEAQRLTF